MMLDIAILVCWVQFFSACFWEGMIFGKVGSFVELNTPHWFYKPFIGCPICMTPWHGLIFWYLFDIDPTAIIIAAGLNTIIAKFESD